MQTEAWKNAKSGNFIGNSDQTGPGATVKAKMLSKLQGLEPLGSGAGNGKKLWPNGSAGGVGGGKSQSNQR